MKPRFMYLLKKILGEWIFINRDPNVSKSNLFVRAYIVRTVDDDFNDSIVSNDDKSSQSYEDK